MKRGLRYEDDNSDVFSAARKKSRVVDSIDVSLQLDVEV